MTDPSSWNVLHDDHIEVNIGGPVEDEAVLESDEGADADGVTLQSDRHPPKQWTVKNAQTGVETTDDSSADEGVSEADEGTSEADEGTSRAPGEEVADDKAVPTSVTTDGGPEEAVHEDAEDRAGDDTADETSDDTGAPDGEVADADDDREGTVNGDGAADDDSAADDRDGGEGDLAIDGAVIERLAAELETRDETDDAVETVRARLGPSSSESVSVKLDHCLTRIGELEAYVDALETFLDEEGSAEHVVDALRSDLESVSDRLETVETRVDEMADTQRDLEDRLERVETDLDAAADDDDLAEVRADHADALSGLRSDLESLEDSLSAFEDWRVDVADALSERPETVPQPAGTEMD